MRLQHVAPLPFDLVFPEEQPRELIEYFKGINKEFLKKVGAFFLGFDNTSSVWSDCKYFIKYFFSKGNADFARQILEKINVLELQSKFSIPYEVSSLKLFEYVFDNEISSNNELSEEEQEVNIFKAYLLLNQINTKSSGRISEASIVDVQEYKKPAAILIANQFHNFDLTNFDLDKLFYTQIIRSVMFFEFLEEEPLARHLLDTFYRKFGVSDYKDYLKRLIPISLAIVLKKVETYTDIDVSKDDDFKESINFIEKLIVDDSSKIEDLDFKGLRSKPLYKVEEGLYRIISPLFALELLYNGLYWKLKETNDTLSDTERIKDFNGLKTLKYSEVFCLHKILKKYFSKGYIQLSGEELDASYQGAPDYYVRNGKRVFLFESKDILPTAEVKESTDFLKIEKLLFDKLYKPKGIMQIISNIKKTLKNDLQFDSNINVNTVIIYPILILHNRLFMVAGINKFLNYWFNDELLIIKEQGFDISRVRPLVVIDIDTLIFNEDVFSYKKLRLEDCLEEYMKDYIAFTNVGRKFVSESSAIDALINSFLPFSFFLDTKIDKLRLRQIPKRFFEKGNTLFD